MSKLKIAEITIAEDNLRGVKEETESFAQLKDSLASRGLINPIAVCPVVGEDGVKRYQLVDGLHRYTAAVRLGWEEITVNVVDTREKADLLVTQIHANAQKVDTKPVEYQKALRKIIAASGFTMTLKELAKLVNRSEAWINSNMGLLKLHVDIQALVDADRISVANALALAKLNPEEQIQYMVWAQNETFEQFGPRVSARIKELGEARAAGREAKREFAPRPKLRRVADIQTGLDAVVSIVQSGKITEPSEIVKAALDWVLSLDPATLLAEKAKFEADEKVRLQAEEDRKKERETKRQERLKAELEKSEKLQKELTGKAT